MLTFVFILFFLPIDHVVGRILNNKNIYSWGHHLETKETGVIIQNNNASQNILKRASAIHTRYFLSANQDDDIFAETWRQEKTKAEKQIYYNKIEAEKRIDSIRQWRTKIRDMCPNVSREDFPEDYLIYLSNRWGVSLKSLKFLKSEIVDGNCIAYFDTSRGVQLTVKGEEKWFLN